MMHDLSTNTANTLITRATHRSAAAAEADQL